MAVLPIKKYPEEVLKKRASPIHALTRDVRRLIDDMVETMIRKDVRHRGLVPSREQVA